MSLLYAAMAAQLALLLAQWLRHPAAPYLRPVPAVLLLLWLHIRGRKQLREYRALKARHRAHEQEILAMLDSAPRLQG
jgi:hypothetical protein